MKFLRFGKLRYQNQEHTTEVLLDEGAITAVPVAAIEASFHETYEREYTYRLDAPVEMVGIHLVASAEVGKLTVAKKEPTGTPASETVKGKCAVDYALEGRHEAAIYDGETYNCPAEINEARNGLYVDGMGLNTAPGGEGEFTGGRGIVMDYRVRGDNGFLTAGYTRSKFPAWGIEGGADGSPNYVEFRPKDGEPQRHAFVSGLTTHPGDVIRVVTGNGGGLGDPRKRDPERVKRDVRNGLLTPERAVEIYGVDIA